MIVEARAWITMKKFFLENYSRKKLTLAFCIINAVDLFYSC